MQKTKTPDAYFKNATKWRDELIALRKILVSTGLTEEIKWGSPFYTLDGKHIVGLTAFKTFFCLWFPQGALLKDERQVLMNAQEGVTKAQRQWRMQSARDIKPAIIKAYVKEAVALAKAGKEIKPQRKGALVLPEELKTALSKNKRAGAAFEKLTPGKQREYADYIAEAKQAATKERRLEKILPMIAAGGGLNDKYKNF
ncbi:YdeI/OmpD-associated family protein [Hyphococcus sp.]|uniref:YdeI/OmpD-associated family protein n=1 Tax=Hyphococcus sp. TaxID=2038636 RepID=UPI0035C69BCD